MEFGLVNINSSLTKGSYGMEAAKLKGDNSKFSDVLKSLKNETLQENKKSEGTTLSSSLILEKGRLNGEYATGFSHIYSSESDKNAQAVGAARNQANGNVKPKTIDKTSTLYEKSMELENFFVKQMLSSMRKTVMKSSESDFAQNMYEDMLYDEYSTAMTKNAGFGLADQIYLSLI